MHITQQQHMQVGKGSYQPQVLCPTGSMHHVFTTQEGKKRGSLVVEWFTFAPSLKVRGGVGGGKAMHYLHCMYGIC